MKRCSGYLKRPEILETVYSVEEDATDQVTPPHLGPLFNLPFLWGTGRLGDSKCKKILKDFGGCHENILIESFKMSPHLICLS